MPNIYAQVKVKDQSEEDEIAAKFNDMLYSSKQDFDRMIELARYDFAHAIDTEKHQSQDARDNSLIILRSAIEDTLKELTESYEGLKQVFMTENQQRTDLIETNLNKGLEAFLAQCDANLLKMDGWFDNRLDWVHNLHDNYYKEHLKLELNSKKESTRVSLQNRKDRAQADVDTVKNHWMGIVGVTMDGLVEFLYENISTFNAFTSLLETDLTINNDATNLAFAD